MYDVIGNAYAIRAVQDLLKVYCTNRILFMRRENELLHQLRHLSQLPPTSLIDVILASILVFSPQGIHPLRRNALLLCNSVYRQQPTFSFFNDPADFSQGKFPHEIVFNYREKVI